MGFTLPALALLGLLWAGLVVFMLLSGNPLWPFLLGVSLLGFVFAFFAHTGSKPSKQNN